MALPRKITLKIEVSRDEDGEILLNGFGPKSQMGKAYRMALHGVLEEALQETDRLEWCANKAKARAETISGLINNILA